MLALDFQGKVHGIRFILCDKQVAVPYDWICKVVCVTFKKQYISRLSAAHGMLYCLLTHVLKISSVSQVITL